MKLFNWLRTQINEHFTRLEHGGWIPKSMVLKVLVVFVSVVLLLFCPGFILLSVALTCGGKLVYALKSCWWGVFR